MRYEISRSEPEIGADDNSADKSTSRAGIAPSREFAGGCRIGVVAGDYLGNRTKERLR
jgi:hypothetical protein